MKMFAFWRWRSRVRNDVQSFRNELLGVGNAVEGVLQEVRERVPDQAVSSTYILGQGRIFGAEALQGVLGWLRTGWTLISCTTAVATGMIAGIGIDFITLVDRWSILSAVSMACAIVIALLSPLLAVPRTMDEIRRIVALRKRSKLVHLERSKITYEVSKEAAEKRERELNEEIAERKKRIDNMQTEYDGLSKKVEELRSGSKFQRFMKLRNRDLIVAAKIAVNECGSRRHKEDMQQRADRSDLALVAGERESIDAHMKSLESQIGRAKDGYNSDLLVYFLRKSGNALYILIAGAVLINLVSEPQAAYLIFAFILLRYASTQLSFSFAAPMAIAHLLLFGYFVGVAMYNMKPNVLIEVNQKAYKKARVLFRTAEGIIAIQHGKDLTETAPMEATSLTSNEAETRHLVMVPQNAVGLIYTAGHTDTWSWLRTLKPVAYLATSPLSPAH